MMLTNSSTEEKCGRSTDTSSGSSSLPSDMELEEFLSTDNFRHFEIVENIGKGAYGSVFKTKSKTDKKFYALKVIPIASDQNEERMNREVEVLSQLQHVNIVRYHTSWYLKNDELSSKSGKDFKCLCIQMEYCDQTLRDFIDNMIFIEDKSERESERKRILMEVLDGVRYIHEQNVMHRDLNPKNIFLTKTGTVKIGDFGIARHSDFYNMNEDVPVDNNDLTSYIGTRKYCSPEVINAKKSYDKRVDGYSLGIIIFEMWYPFPPETTEMEKCQIFEGIKSESVIIPQSFESEVIKEIVVRLLQHDPNKRIELDEVTERLSTEEDESPIDDSPTPPIESKIVKSVGRLAYGTSKKLVKGCCFRLGSGPFVITTYSVVKRRNFPDNWTVIFKSTKRKLNVQKFKPENPVWYSTDLDIAILELESSEKAVHPVGLEMHDQDIHQKLFTFTNINKSKSLAEISERTLPENPAEDITLSFDSSPVNRGAPVVYVSDQNDISVFGIIKGHSYRKGIRQKGKTVVRNLQSVYESVDPIMPGCIRKQLFSSSPYFKCHERILENIENLRQKEATFAKTLEKN